MKLVLGRVILIFTLLIGFSIQAKELLKTPTMYRWVQDYANVLEANQESYLISKLRDYFDSTSTEIVIVMDESLEGENIQQYSLKLAEKWGIGQEKEDNGLLIYSAIKDRQIFIQVGKGLEGAIPDIYANRIIEDILAPYYRKKQYGLGLDKATDIIIKMASGEYVNTIKPIDRGIPKWVFLFIIIILISLFSKGGNDSRTYDDRGNRRRRPTIWIGGGGLGGGSSGGGFGGGFGGGSFGGGGAGGSW